MGVISELVISIVANSSKATKELDSTRKSVTSVGDSAKLAGESIKKNLESALSSLVKTAVPIATVTGAMVALTKAQNDLVAVGKQADRTGIPVEDLQAWGRAADSLGYSSEDAKNALVSLQEGMQEAALTGQGKMAGMLQYLGIAMEDANGKMRSSSDVMKDLSARFSRMSQAKAIYLGKMMGLTPDTIALLRQGKTLSNELADAYKHVQSAEDIEKAEQLDKAIGALVTSGEDLAKNLLVGVAPAITAVFKALTPLAQLLADNPFFTVAGASAFAFRGVLTSVASSILGTTKVVGGLFSAIGKLGMVIPLFGKVASTGLYALKILGSAFKANPIGLAITALIAVISDFYDFLNGAPSLTGDFLEWIGLSGKAIEDLKKGFNDLVSGAKEFFGLGDDKEKSEGKGEEKQTESGFSKIAKGTKEFFGFGDDDEKSEGKTNKSTVSRSATLASAPSYSYNGGNSSVSNRTANVEIHNEVNVTANGGDVAGVRKAVSGGVSDAMGNYQSTVENFETGVSY